MFQNLLNILTSPISFFILFALIGGIGRFASWFKDQRSKRDALADRRAAEAESLRTGRSGKSPADVSAAATQAPAARNAAAERQARLRQLQEQRAAQLRELQQKRLAELRARRAAQQSGGQPTSPGTSPARGSARPQTPTATARQAPKPPQPRTSARPSPRVQPVALSPSLQLATPAEKDLARRRDRRAEPDAFTIDRHDLAVEGAIQTKARALAADKAFDQRDRDKPSHSSASVVFRSREDLRRGILAAEILGKPIAFRDEQ